MVDEAKHSSGATNGILVGFVIFMSMQNKKEPCRLQERVITFESTCQLVCDNWVKRIRRIIEDLGRRPKTLKVFIQPFAGNGKGKECYKRVVAPLFQSADIETDITEDRLSVFEKTQDDDPFVQCINHMDMSKYDGIVCVGGDTTVLKVVSALLLLKQVDQEIAVAKGFTPKKVNMPIGIIPTGGVNTIVCSCQGVADATTAALHIILGK
ncbi:PREDICTED: ceramide kinase-like [Priapulus caudatus]|uniref:Ceramide kinase-like n=1 Tax=Priapulus caudatus TaxID=37621 RepID=A0ABM1F4K1_PRICU|nr:PREDICTED: ceramide kinase-like [Priapulus caudatus]